MLNPKKHQFLYSLLFVLLITSFSSCSNNEEKIEDSTPQETVFGIFEVLDDEVTVEMNGEIESGSLDDFNG